MGEIESLGFKRLGHVRYLPDIAPSDFFLFGEVKRQQKMQCYNSVDDLEMTIRSIVDRLRAKTFNRVFDDWIERRQPLLVSDGKISPGNKMTKKESVIGDLPLSFRRLMK
jgi:hypothetical protein